jgi:hypothetical protein
MVLSRNALALYAVILLTIVSAQVEDTDGKLKIPPFAAPFIGQR